MFRNISRYSILSAIVAALFLCVGFCTIGHYGMGWDEVTRWNSGDIKIQYYETLFTSDSPMAVMEQADADRYPGLFDMTLSLLHRSTGFDRFYLGHLMAAFFAGIALLVVWLCARMLGGSELAFWSFLFLLLIPCFYGHAFHNPKDIPFAAMYMLGVYSLASMARYMPRIPWRSALTTGICVGLAMSVRIAGIVIISYYAALVVLWLLQVWAKREVKCSFHNAFLGYGQGVFRFLMIGAFIGLVALGILMIWWPAGHRNIFAASSDTFQQLHSSASTIPLFFRGEWMDASEAPFYYTLWMFFIKSPESLIGLLTVLFIGLIVHLKNGFRLALTHISLPWFVVFLGGVFPLIYLTFSAPALHNGARHFMFVYPPLCVLAAKAWLSMNAYFIGRKQSNFARLGSLCIGGLLVIQVLSLVALHPYQYTYFNHLSGGPASAYARYETEYWFTSTKHGIEWLDAYLSGNEEKERVQKVFITGPWQVAQPFLPPTLELTSEPDQADFILANTQMCMDQLVPARDIHVIQRMGLPILYIRSTK